MALNECKELRELLQLLCDLHYVFQQNHNQEQEHLQLQLQEAKDTIVALNQQHETFAKQVQAEFNLREMKLQTVVDINNHNLEELTLNGRSQKVQTPKITLNQLREESILQSRLVCQDAEIAAINHRVTELQAQLARKTTKTSRKLKCLKRKNRNLQRLYMDMSSLLLKTLAEKDSLAARLSQSKLNLAIKATQLSTRDKDNQELHERLQEMDATIWRLEKAFEDCCQYYMWNGLKSGEYNERCQKSYDQQKILEPQLEEDRVQNVKLTEAHAGSARKNEEKLKTIQQQEQDKTIIEWIEKLENVLKTQELNIQLLREIWEANQEQVGPNLETGGLNSDVDSLHPVVKVHTQTEVCLIELK